MLQAMHSGKASNFIKLIVFGMIGFAMLGLAFTDVGGFFRNGGVGSNNVAVIGRNAIGISSFYRQYQNTLRQANLDSQTAKALNFPYKVLQQEISRRVLIQAAWNAGLRISETFVANDLAKQLDEMGVTADKREEFFKDYLRRTGMSEAQIINNIRQDASTTLMMDSIQQPFEVPLYVAQQLYRFEKEERRGDIISIDFKNIKDIPNFSDEELNEYYQTHSELSAIPETRDISYVVISKDAFLKEQNISDEQIENYYNENIASFTIPAARKFEQVVVDSEEKAQRLADIVKKGEMTLENAATEDEYEYIPADFFTQQDLPEEIKPVVFAEETKEMPFVATVKTSYGYHVINVIAERQAEQKPLNDALKKEIVAHLKDTTAEESVYKTAEELEDLAASGMTIHEIAKELALNVKTIKQTTVTGTTVNSDNLVKGIASANDILNSAFGLFEGEVSPIIEGENLTLMAVGVDAVVASSQKPFDVVKGDINKAMKERFQSTEARNKVDAILAKFKDTPKPLTDLAKEFDVAVTKTQWLERTGDEKTDGITNDIRNSLFLLDGKQDIQSHRTPTGFAIVALNDVKTPAKIPSEGKEIDALKEGIGQAISADIMEEFVGYWRNRLDVKINDAVIQNYFYKSEDE